MQSREFTRIRHYLGDTQGQLARLFCVSPKAIQSYEQGWRNIPASIERQLLFLLSMKRSLDERTRPCWEINNCPNEWRRNCAAWEFKAGHLGWFINGAFCKGNSSDSCEQKMQLCRQCEVFRLILRTIWDHKPIAHLVTSFRFSNKR